MKVRIVIDGRTVEKVARALFSKRALGVLFAFALLVTSGTVFAISDTPNYTFKPGTIISASRVNANFAALFAEVFEIEQSVITGILKGDKGDKGDVGDKGLKGLSGDKGDLGPRGPRGPKGDKGESGDKGDPGQKGPDGLKPFLDVSACNKGESCCSGAGGTRIETGWDKNGDGKFTKPGEVTSTALICNGTNGKDGKNGTPWTAVGPTGSTAFPTGPVFHDYFISTPAFLFEDGADNIPYTFCALIDVRISDSGTCSIVKSGKFYKLTGQIGALTAFNGRYVQCEMRCYQF